jgi:hypothetical protein
MKRSQQKPIPSRHQGSTLMAAAALALLAPLVASASVSLGEPNTTSLSSGLVGYWPLDGATTNWATNTTRDLSGQGNTGTLVSMSTTTSPVAGKIGQALQLNGTGYIQSVNNSGYSSLTQPYTIALWIDPANDSGGDLITTARGTSPWDGIWLIRGAACGGGASKTISISTNDLSANSLCVYTSATTVSANVWTHVVATYDGTNHSSGFKVYINGRSVSLATISNSSGTSYTNRPWAIGSIPNSGISYYRGALDDVRIYNRALSAQEVALLYATGQAHVDQSNKIGINSGLVGYWPLDGATTNWTSNTTRDVSGNGNSGTLVGMSTTTSPVAGKIGQALKFNGANYINSVRSAQTFNDFTAAVWEKNQNVAALPAFVSFNDPTYTADNFPIGIFVQLLNTGIVQCGIRSTAGGSFTGISGGLAVNDNKWHSVVCTRSGSTGTFYIDGVPALSGNLTSSAIAANGSFQIGAIHNGASGWAYNSSGSLDDVRIYNRALSAQEVAQLYTQGGGHIAQSNTTSLSSGLVGYWPLDGATTNWKTNTTSDLSGQGNTGTLVSLGTTTAPVAGKIGQALKFDGASSYVSFTSEPLFQVSATNLSVSFWSDVTPTKLGSTYKIVYDNAADNFSFTQGVAVYFEGRTNANGVVGTGLFEMNVGTGSGQLLMASLGSIPSDGKWHHYTGAYDGTTIKLYIDGVAVSMQTSSTYHTAGNFSPRNHALNIGRSEANNAGYFPAKLDDVRVYNRALSAQEVSQLYAMGK